MGYTVAYVLSMRSQSHQSLAIFAEPKDTGLINEKASH